MPGARDAAQRAAVAASAAEADGSAHGGYGEQAVQALCDQARALQADLIVAPWPRDGLPPGTAAVAIEAARRLGGDLALLLTDVPAGAPPIGADARAVSGAWRFAAGDLDDALSALWAAGACPAGARPAADASGIGVVVRSMDRPTLAAALASLAWQTLRPDEVLVVNAAGAAHGPLPDVPGLTGLRLVGASDGSCLPRSRAANLGLAGAGARRLLFLDDDDLVLPDHLAKLRAALDADPLAVAAYGDVDHGWSLPGGWKRKHLFAADFDPVRLCFENYLPIHAVLFDRGIVDAGVRFDERLDLLEDWDFWLECAARGPFIRVPGVSARYQAGTADNSNVFADDEPAQRAQGHLFAKWQHRLSREQFVGAMRSLQRFYRLERHASERLTAALLEIDSLRALVADREAEIANLRAHADGLGRLVQARETQIAAQQRAIDDLREQAATAGDHAASLSSVLAARDHEIAQFHAADQSLREALASKDAHVSALQAREHELAVQANELRGQLQRLLDEKPLQALARTLKSRTHEG